MDNDRDWFSLTIPSQTRYMVLVRTIVSSFSQRAGYSEKAVHEIVVAVDEACTNIIRHCYKGCPDKRILLDCGLTESGIEIRLRDYGPKPDLAKIKSPDSRGQKPGGLGLILIQNAMDRVAFNTSRIGLELVMFKQLET